jgi:hypothetical protein
MQQKGQPLRAKVLRPVFRVADAAFGFAMLGLVSAYIVRKYAEFALTGDWGRRINIDHPSIRREQPNQRRPFNGTSDGV